MRRIGAVVVVVVLAIAAGCGDDDGGESAPACDAVSASALQGALAGPTVTSEESEHEDGNGTWCLYHVDDQRLELRVRTGDRDKFDDLRSSSRDAGAVEDVDGIGDAAFWRAQPVHSVVGIDGERIAIVQVLDADVPDATAETLLRLALAAAPSGD